MSKVVRWFFILLLAINILYVLSGVLNFPMRSMDAFSDWMLKAKVFYLDGSFPLHFFQDWSYMASHMQYPILIPTIFAFIYRGIGEINEKSVLLLYPIFYTIILIFVYKTLKYITKKHLTALIFTYIYSMLSPFLAQGGRGHAGNADIFIVLMGWIIVFLIIHKEITEHKKLFYIALCVAASSMMKLEGVFYIIPLLFYPLSIKRKIPYLVIALTPFFVWSFIVQYYEFAADIVYRIPSLHIVIQRFTTVMVGTIREMANYKNWYIFWPLFFLSLSGMKNAKKETKLFLCSSLIIFLGFASSYLFAFFAKTEINIYNYVSSSMDRVLFQLTPLLFTSWVTLVVQQNSKKTKLQKSKNVA